MYGNQILRPRIDKEEAMSTRCIVVCITAITTVVVLASCQVRPWKETTLDKNWGRSFEAARYNQILNPDAAGNGNPVVGIDGEIAAKSIQKYRTMQMEPSSSGDYGDLVTSTTK